MKFRMFTDLDGHKIAINVDDVRFVQNACNDDYVEIWVKTIHAGKNVIFTVKEDFDTVFSRLNTIAE